MIYDANITSDKRIKIRTIKDDITDTYDVDNNSSVIPLTRGAGHYRVLVYENVAGNKYKLLRETAVDVTKSHATDFALMENAHVRFTKSVSEITRTIYDSVRDKNDRSIAEALAKWVKKNIAYDYVKS